MKINFTKENISEFKREYIQKKCFYADCDSERIIDAHSIQENGPLKLISDEVDGQRGVYFLDNEFFFDVKEDKMATYFEKSKIYFRGIKKASVFGGFCEKHDKIFKSTIEDVKFENSVDQFFYYSYRAFAYSIHKEFEFLKSIETVNDKIQSMMTKTNIPEVDLGRLNNHPLGKTMSGMLDHLKGLTNSMSSLFNHLKDQSDTVLYGLALRKARFDHAVVEKRYNDLVYFYRAIPDIYPVTCSTVLQYLDLLVPSGDGVAYAPDYAITIFPDKDSNMTHVIIGAFPENLHVAPFFNRLCNMKMDDFKKFISTLIISRGNNIYISPRIYNKMTLDEREELIRSRINKDKVDIGLPLINLSLFNETFADSINQPV